MRTAGPAAFELLSGGRGRSGAAGEPAVDARDRRNISGVSVFRFPTDDAMAPPPGPSHQSQARTASDAAHGFGSDLSKTESVPGKCRAPDLSVSVAPPRGRSAEPSLGHGHYLCTGAGWLRLSLCGHRLAQPLRARLGTVQYARRELLRARGPTRGRRPRYSGNLQHRPRLPVYFD